MKRLILAISSILLLTASIALAIEALVERSTGKIIVAKADGAPWSQLERTMPSALFITVTNSALYPFLYAAAVESGTEWAGMNVEPFVMVDTNNGERIATWTIDIPTAEAEMKQYGSIQTTNCLRNTDTVL